MSYYSTVLPEQRIQYTTAFDGVFEKDGPLYVAHQTFHMLNKAQLSLVLDHVGYQIYQALRLRRKFQLKKTSILTYMPQYYMADNMAAALLRVMPLDTIQTYNKNAHDMLQRFLKVDNL